jgi:uncharacterized membrane protein
MALPVYIGSSIVVTASFSNAVGGAATVNSVVWSTDPPEGGEGAISLVPDPAPALTATVTGVYAGLVTLIATPDTNANIQATVDINVIDPTNTPASGTIS